MNERRPLTEGIKKPQTIDSAVVREFVHAGKTPPPAKAEAPAAMHRAPISTRIRDDFAKALKRASLERQLEGIEPNTLQDMLEQAIEPWLREHGYLE